MSVGHSENSSSGANTSSGMNQSYIDSTQKGYLQDLWSNATQGILQGGVGAANPQMQQQFMNLLQNNPAMGQAMQFANPNNEMTQNNISMLSKNLQDQYQNVFMPQNADNAIQTGQLGGGRQGVAQGLGQQGFQRALSEGAQGIMNNAYGQAQQASQFGAGMYNQIANQGLAGLGMMQQQQMMPLMSLAQILGSPTVLNKGTNFSYGRDSSEGSERHFGFMS